MPAGATHLRGMHVLYPAPGEIVAVIMTYHLAGDVVNAHLSVTCRSRQAATQYCQTVVANGNDVCRG